MNAQWEKLAWITPVDDKCRDRADTTWGKWRKKP